ncbi:helix-turn-helix domain-containing protein [Roseomonas populi]|uniref:Short-chain fatty acyl-CoA regulator family protein n=1 Tax=Roseomonas populi TaxID=3121582 RepID=A0ABT1WZD6_9PROT|nr:helix-turn-helix transcriptional regulator [Roseomonas pecuniae]MCR0980829.1 short-chain fatty acyl-CoA regulator family protein [Roseomonas pecuniae]
MARPMIGRVVRRLRKEKGLTQASLALRLGISASYMNLIEADQRTITASLVFKLADALGVDLAVLSGQAEGRLEAGLQEVFRDPLLGAESVPEEQVAALAAAPDAARAVLALWRAWRVAREDSAGLALPSGRRILLPTEEARDAFHDAANHFPLLEETAEALRATMEEPSPQGLDHALAQRLRAHHGLSVTVGVLPGAALRRYDAAAAQLLLSESLPRESRSFHLAFTLGLLEARDAVDRVIAAIGPSSEEAGSLLRIGLLNYVAAAVMMPYAPFQSAARALRHDVAALSARFAVSFEQACHRLSTLQREGARGLPFFFLRVDPAGNVSKRFSAAGFPFARGGGSCPRWIPHAAFATPGRVVVQVAELPDGAAFLCFARTVEHAAVRWGEPAPVHVVAMGCELGRAEEVCYADGIDLDSARVGIGLSCRLCDRVDCRSRAFPPLEHRLLLDPASAGAPYRFSPAPSAR